MSTAVVLITGLGGKSKISAGLAALRAKLLPLNLAMLEVFPWTVDADKLADKIVAIDPDQTIIVAHSFGVWKAALVASSLDYAGHRVEFLFSADGVSRDRPRVLTIPWNVETLDSWRGTKSIIKGSPIALAHEGRTYWRRNEILDSVPHNKIDGLSEVHDAVIRACQE